MRIPPELAVKLDALKVLIIDDQHHMRKVIRAMLASLGVRNVHEAPNGADGLSAVVSHLPDLILVDWDMPLLNGLEFVQMVREGGAVCPSTPIIMLTGHGERWRVAEAARMGVNEFLTKPVSTQALFDRIVSVLLKPRPMMKLQDNFVPAPRRLVVIDTGLR